MGKNNPDIDIDVPNRNKILEYLNYVPATIKNVDGSRVKHKSGVYFQNMPINPLDGLAIYDYKEAEKKGFFKIDFLPNSIYEGIRDEDHLIELLTTEPIWELFLYEEIVSQLAQVHSHIDVLREIKPTSIEELAICLAIIRPGKEHLRGRNMDEIRKEIWESTTKYYYKKSHAIAFAASVVVQLNLLVEKLNEADSNL